MIDSPVTLYAISANTRRLTMSTTEIVLTVAAGLLLVMVIFLGREMVKKFGYMRQFVAHSLFKHECLLEVDARGMYNVVIHNRQLRPFSVLIGFELKLPGCSPGFDYYGCMDSNQEGELVFRIWMKGGQPLKTVFLFNHEVLMAHRGKLEPAFTVYVGSDDLVPNTIYPPHWWQKHLHIFG
ncbi:MAG: hypothetical protein NT034_04075 [Candidatus Magasanikbacteria bacterium]|nr:hypothetical protein [Candidatus Magasanikbacteria bacterium]